MFILKYYSCCFFAVKHFVNFHVTSLVYNKIRLIDLSMS